MGFEILNYYKYTRRKN